MRCQETGQIWLIGGTRESSELARALVQAQIPCIVTVTTDAARSLYPSTAYLQIWIGRLDSRSLPDFLQKQQIVAVLDASHPFAVEISELAIAATNEFQIPYLRYERPEINSAKLRQGKPLLGAREVSFENLDALFASSILTRQRILLTIGHRSLHRFQPWQEQATLFARLLPSTTALEAALAAGFTSDRLIAFRPPVSAEMERALWQQWQISMVVTKASGASGGEDVKRQIAAELGVTLVLIDRPPISYPQQTSDSRAAVKFCQDCLPRTSSCARSSKPNSK
ncbi:cobalt-precorrin-6A reductase [Leptothermofonsia sp. ETS-13]|uniref:cobalt-precorrin-6A reductase n=1 Tax=Leptothermofonsia sp. ETS-13 TaxID=3035696 RepID=UPI003BA394DF